MRKRSCGERQWVICTGQRALMIAGVVLVAAGLIVLLLCIPAWAWAALICLSTVFTKQHSVIDVACGLAVAFVWLPVVYRPARALH